MITIRPNMLNLVLLSLIGFIAAAVILIGLFIHYARQLLEQINDVHGQNAVILSRTNRAPLTRTDGSLDQPLDDTERYQLLRSLDHLHADDDTGPIPLSEPTAPIVRPDIAAGARLPTPDRSYALSPRYVPERLDSGGLVPAFRAPNQTDPPPPAAARRGRHAHPDEDDTAAGGDA